MVGGSIAFDALRKLNGSVTHRGHVETLMPSYIISTFCTVQYPTVHCPTQPYHDDIVQFLTLRNEMLLWKGLSCCMNFWYNKIELFPRVQSIWKLDSNGCPASLSMKQPLYAKSILRRFGLENLKPAIKLVLELFYTGIAAESDKSAFHIETYQIIVSLLFYLAHRTRLTY